MSLNNKISYGKALIIPFRIAPIATILSIFHGLINLAIAPINVLVTAYFINTALAVVTEGQDASQIVLPLFAMAAFSVYGYITSPLMQLLNQHRAIKMRLALRVPFIEKRARLEYKHAENNETVDLINRVWNDPIGRISGILQNVVSFITLVGTSVSLAVILFVNAPLAGTILVVLSLPIFVIASKAGKANYEAQRETTTELRYAWNFDWVLRDRNIVAERNLFGYTDFLSKKYEHYFEVSRMYKRFAELTRSKMAILVTHRLGSVRIADRIAVMDGGKIVEVGTHDSLLAEGGKYAEMWAAQAENYQLQT